MAQENKTDEDSFEDLEDEYTENDIEIENPAKVEDEHIVLARETNEKLDNLVSGLTAFIENQGAAKRIVPTDSPFRENLEVMQAMAKISESTATTIIKVLNEGAKLGEKNEAAKQAATVARLEAEIDYLRESKTPEQRNPTLEIVEAVMPVVKEGASILSERLNPGGQRLAAESFEPEIDDETNG